MSYRDRCRRLQPAAFIHPLVLLHLASHCTRRLTLKPPSSGCLHLSIRSRARSQSKRLPQGFADQGSGSDCTHDYLFVEDKEVRALDLYYFR